jgi:hypothetical protein
VTAPECIHIHSHHQGSTYECIDTSCCYIVCYSGHQLARSGLSSSIYLALNPAWLNITTCNTMNVMLLQRAYLLVVGIVLGDQRSLSFRLCLHPDLIVEITPVLAGPYFPVYSVRTSVEIDWASEHQTRYRRYHR